MSRIFLDPKNDIVFKRIFGEHPRILRSFLNALLPLGVGHKIVKVSYLPPEQVPQLPLFKNSIVDVKCVDEAGRQFIVEMQINWTDAFLHRVLFNASKAFVRQLEKGEDYKLLKPVMGLSLLDDTFDKSRSYYHHYKMVNVDRPKAVIDGLQLVFIELPKFSPARERHNLVKKAWLRFLKELGSVKTTAEAEKLAGELSSQAPEIREAIKLSREIAFTPSQLEAYDQYWDAVSRERTLTTSAREEGRMEGRMEGLTEGRMVGKMEGASEKEQEIEVRMRAAGFSEDEIRKVLGLSGLAS